MMFDKRSSGVLLHITSLPSKYGIGDLGPEAYNFADKLVAAGQRFWQILPLNPTDLGYGNSPYSSHSAFAGNPLLISPELLVQDGLLEKKDLKTDSNFAPDKVNYNAVVQHRLKIWQQVWLNYKNSCPPTIKQEFKNFKNQNQNWLPEFALFVALKEHFEKVGWVSWPDELKHRQPEALEEYTEKLKDTIEKEKLLQFLFYRQWQALKDYCNQRKLYFIGDMPFYVSHDSADVWANQLYFKLDKKGMPTAVSGVPPDYFSETGQLWGTPVFNWSELQKNHFDWWLRRVSHNLRLFDLLRLDHFRAFSAYWEVPAGDKTAINGTWQPTPGAKFLKLVQDTHPEMPIIAEDLGEIDDPVRELQKQFSLPGMLVLLFAFGEDLPHSIYAPHNHYQRAIVYTGTHDNSTVRGWYEKDASAGDKKRLEQYSNYKLTKENAHEAMAILALGSVAKLAVLPVQDIIGLGSKATMNKPSTASGNWEWRLLKNQFTAANVKWLKQKTEIYGRGQ